MTRFQAIPGHIQVHIIVLLQVLNNISVLHFFDTGIIIFLVKRIYPSIIFFTNPLFNYLYSPERPRTAPLYVVFLFLIAALQAAPGLKSNVF